jgi:hypothetical protein
VITDGAARRSPEELRSATKIGVEISTGFELLFLNTSIYTDDDIKGFRL